MAIANGYATLAQFRLVVQETSGVTTDDAIYERAVESYSRAIDDFCGRRFWEGTSETRTYVAEDPTWLSIHDLVSLTSLKTDDDGDGTFETTWASDDYELVRPDIPGLAPSTVPYTSIEAVDDKAFPVATSGRRRLVQVVGIFGWDNVPMNVEQACLLGAARLFKRRSSPEGVAGFGSFGEIRISNRHDPDAVLLLQPLQRLLQPAA